jgi:uncharacterized membrane protein
MSMLDRVKNILLTPKTEWPVIEQEQTGPSAIFTKYVLPLLLLGALASFIGYAFVGVDLLFVKIKGLRWGLSFGIRYLISGAISFWLASYVLDALAPQFQSEKNIDRSARLVAYASTPSWIAALFMAIPALAILGLFGLYGIYLFYIGLPVMKKTPDDRRIAYMIVGALVIFILGAALQWAVGGVLNLFLGDPYASTGDQIRSMFR